VSAGVPASTAEIDAMAVVLSYLGAAALWTGDLDAAGNALRGYRRSLPRERRRLLDGSRYAHLARKVVGLGSVGTRCWILLLLGRDSGDPLFLQLKEAQNSVLAPFAGASEFKNQGQRVVEGQRLVQAVSDILLGWFRTAGIDGTPRDFYVRQLWDWKVSPNIERMAPSTMRIYGQACGWTLARAPARTRAPATASPSPPTWAPAGSRPRSRSSRRPTPTRTSATIGR
jgi:hypothetical protein